jgi:hypothetical protein
MTVRDKGEVADALDICIQYLTRALALGPSSAPDLSWLAPVPFIETYHMMKVHTNPHSIHVLTLVFLGEPTSLEKVPPLSCRADTMLLCPGLHFVRPTDRSTADGRCEHILPSGGQKW